MSQFDHEANKNFPKNRELHLTLTANGYFSYHWHGQTVLTPEQRVVTEAIDAALWQIQKEDSERWLKEYHA